MNRNEPFDSIYFIAHTRYMKGTAFSSDPEPGYYVVETHCNVAAAGPYESRKEARRARRAMLHSEVFTARAP